ncbi:ABC transporter substrate-binding protein [Liquorilactobacillus mali]|uniref:Extracellular solute-binding protein n=2 Tax=Liquorilactobacillus TaxID=2767888 RepID=J0UT89_9LACO|nr:ABC transporter substrate-binding protein [Liquorilactobacillus mali]EJF00561.1 extracellular solute-binding protein [Liquorilactobacillus mali KCTC 3596 = DSM 20444]KRN10174.1 extracellular solute-binding protein [Liquorilactobacillus mali KCTC 3596 = DSM 20444]MDC7953046.1 amino acid ABC transporter substrate-binding protein [Liquorilactobacillus mali]QFQ74047.1 amino acid ABC transporter substrate-binding protein [Liquorilactobacillus mali]
MKKRILLMLLSITALLLFVTACSSGKSSSKSSSTSSSTDTLAKIKKKGVLVVGSSNDAPFAYIDTKTKKFTGIDADIIKEIAKRIGIKKVEMKQVPFENLLVELNKGSIDMVTDAMYIKKERLQKAAFTDIWYKEGDAVVIPKNSSINSLSDLKGKVIGAQKGTAFLEIAEKWKKEGIVKDVQVYGKQTELMLAVDTGKIAACVTDGIVADYTLSKDSSLSLKLLSSYKSEATGQIGAAVNFSDKSLLNATNKALNKMKKDGTLKKILAKYGLSDKYMVSVSDGITKNIK